MNATVLKTVVRGDSHRGFESHPLRQEDWCGVTSGELAERTKALAC